MSAGCSLSTDELEQCLLPLDEVLDALLHEQALEPIDIHLVDFAEAVRRWHLINSECVGLW